MAIRMTRVAIAMAVLGALTACSASKQSFGEAIGATVTSPDAFNVLPHAPLRLPPSLSDLPPPQPGAPSPLDPQPIVAARAALSNAGEPANVAIAPTPGEQSLVATAGGAQADPLVREELATDPYLTEQSKYGLDSLFGLKVPDGSEKELLAPRDENKRLIEDGDVAPSPTPPPPPRQTNSFTLGG